MAKLYGKLWNERLNAMSTRAGSREITTQLLYESETKGRTIGIEAWIIRRSDGSFLLHVNIPGKLNADFELDAPEVTNTI